ncbi:carbon-nitrogen hydrolase family protein [Phormidium sp. FACHB-322]|uniref:carbon-nitrogen hydrolase family protein n=1 Tax=Cyanophyceae TaxID=3028117 RepID=UPI00168318B3|nr:MULTISPECIES: carbon-nitrogen hydrolase family protein [Cyanophyceae]MBD1915383.1 carbon-nitrogen hydrolase family protein [Phormidium sp. FACHB-77]MBD2028948.1 carbon-nitrogen hydrolase family protein [Phormidium sp. FACHB-322]MBD2049395.1 carbon-nitrogen hydrolase family protein [Leptolyngbya sp. FACHB-60]
MARRKFRAAVVQTLAALGDLDFNINLLDKYAQEAARQGAELVVFPECMNTGYLFDSQQHCSELAETITGKYVEAMADLCRKHGLFIASGFTEKDEVNEKIFNSGLLLDKTGKLILHYQKQFLATHDQNWFECGVKGSPVVDTELGRIGLLICFDGRIPEIARCLALQGADIILDMANFFAMDQAEMWVPARAFENESWIIAATKAGVERSIYYPGGSMIVAPTGQVAAKIPYDTHGVVSADIIFSEEPKTKLGNRRPDIYQRLLTPFEETPVAAFLKQPLIPEEETTKVAAVQCHRTDEPNSLDAAFEMVSHAAKLEVKLLALPLHFGSPMWNLNHQEAEDAAKDTEVHINRAGEIARDYGCAIVLPVIEKIGDILSSSATLIGPEGHVIGRYRQTHLSPSMQAWAKAGDELPVFETPFGRIGIILGDDGLYPESTRILALNGADIIVWCSAWVQPSERELLAVPKAEDNRVYLVCVNRTDCPYPGGSFVVPPNGFPHWDVNISAPRTTRHGAVMPTYANLALSRQKRMIPNVDMLRNRLIETYGPLVNTSIK